MFGTSSPLVTIVTPVYNGARYVAETLESVLSQTYPYIEHLVLDDGSTDETPSILAEFALKYPERLRVLRHVNIGQIATVNRGFLHSKGEIIGWLNADDCYTPNAIAQAVDALTADPTRVVVYSGVEIIDQNSVVISSYPTKEADFESLIFSPWCPVLHCSMFLRRDVLFNVGLLDPYFFYTMDLDWLIRIALRYSLHYLPDRVWSRHRRHPDAKTFNSSAKHRSAEDYLYLYTKLLAMPGLPATIKKRRWEAMSLADWQAATCLRAGGQKQLAIKYMLRAVLLGPPQGRIDGLKTLVKWIVNYSC